MGRHRQNYAYHTIWAYRSSCINTKIMLEKRSALLGVAINHVGLHSEELFIMYKMFIITALSKLCLRQE